MAFVGICDADHSWSLTYAEVSSKECAAVQEKYFGGVLSEDDFNTVDANNDGEITVNEVIKAAINFFSRSSSRNDEGIGDICKSVIFIIFKFIPRNHGLRWNL